MDYVQQVAAAGFVLLLLAATLWWLRRRGPAGLLRFSKPPDRRLQCLERLALSPQHTLHLVRLGGSTLLLASTPSGCTLIQSIPEDARPAEGDAR